MIRKILSRAPIAVLVLLLGAGCGARPANAAASSDSSQCVAPLQNAPSAGIDEFLGSTPPSVQGRHVNVSIEGRPAGQLAIQSRNEADRLVEQLAHARVVKKGKSLIPMDYKQFRNDCEDRAEVGVGVLLDSHPTLEIGKVFVSGKLSVFNELTWGYHVAPVVVERTADKVSDIWVLDPAIDAQHALTIRDWIAVASSTSPDGTELTVHIASPGSWNFVYGTSTAPAHSGPASFGDKFCAEVDAAKANLERFARRSPARVNLLTHVKVGSLDPRGFVILQGLHRRYGPYAVRLDVMRELQKLQSLEQYVNTKRQRLYTDSRFGNFWRFMTGGLETVFEVSADSAGVGEAEKTGEATTPSAVTQAQ